MYEKVYCISVHLLVYCVNVRDRNLLFGERTVLATMYTRETSELPSLIFS